MAHVSAATRVPRRAFVLACAVALALALGAPVAVRAADDAGSLEHRVKAAFLYKFASYVTWPEAAFASPDSPIAIGVMGAGGVAEELDQVVMGRTVGDRSVTVRRIKAGDSLGGLHMLFIGRPEAAHLAQLGPSAQAQSILTVTESEGALRQGSVINFTLAEQRVRFEISLDSAEKSGLKLSSQLLSVAQNVVTGAR